MQRWYPVILIVAVIVAASWYAQAGGQDAPQTRHRYQIDNLDQTQRVFDTETGVVYYFYFERQGLEITTIDPVNRFKAIGKLTPR